MFKNAPSDVLLQDCRPLDPILDYYMESQPVVSAHEDLASTDDISVRLGDLGVGKRETLQYATYLILGIFAHLGVSASWFDRHLTEWIQPERLRAPEVILGAPWDHKVDIWNLGLVVRILLHCGPGH